MEMVKNFIRNIIKLPIPKVYKKSDKHISEIISDPEFLFLISFPRTGSHWLRHIIELYFERPLLLRSFYFGNKKNFFLYHTHDLTNVNTLGNEKSTFYIYLYREPVNTIYSQLRYHEEDLFDEKRVFYWAHLYASHIQKWMIYRNKNAKCVFVKYENLEHKTSDEFNKICNFLNQPFNENKFNKVVKKISYQNVKKSTNDIKVVNHSSEYKIQRTIFQEKYHNQIYRYINTINPAFSTLFNESK